MFSLLKQEGSLKDNIQYLRAVGLVDGEEEMSIDSRKLIQFISKFFID